MAYIGKSIESGTFAVLDTSGNTYNGSNTTFSLGTQVGSAAQLLVSHDGVIQKPGTDYTLASGGASITFSTAPASGASIFIVEISGAVGGTITPIDDSVTADKINDNIISGQTALGATPADTDEFLVSDAGTIKRVDYSYIKASNTPAFLANLSGTQSIPHDSATKVAFASEVFDTDSVYDASTNYRFTPGVAGKYFLYARIGFQEHNTSSGSVTDQAEISARIYKNGTSIAHTGNHSSVSSVQGAISCTTAVIADLDADDYVEVYASVNNNNSNNAANLLSNLAYNEFGGYKLIGV
tara:strand:- start:124 stop:1014 length:891 start_codon:yes stop_codon:yes gene_type:complete